MEKYKLHYEIAEKLLFPLWLSVDKDFKVDNSKDIWRFFEQFVSTSATQPTLSSFWGQFKRICPYEKIQKYEKQIVEYLKVADDDVVLELLREFDLPLIIIMTAEINSERKGLF